MTDHPAKRCTSNQRRTFEQIAIGNSAGHHPKTIKALLAKGLIERGDDYMFGGDRFGPIAIPTYYVPLPIHAEWCEWCSEQFDDQSVVVRA